MVHLSSPWKIQSWTREPLGLGGNFRRNRRFKKRVAQILVELDGSQELLPFHVSVIKTGNTLGRRNSVDQAVVVVNFVLYVALLVGRIAPGKSLLDRQVRGAVQ